jgi:hypothetical protein
MLMIFELIHPELGASGKQTQPVIDQSKEFVGALKAFPNKTIITIIK